MYEVEIKFLNEHEDPSEKTNKDRVKLSDDVITALTSESPGLPEEYLMYLKEIGWGTFRECQFGVFEPICYFEDLYDVGIEFEPKRYLSFGHNFSGDTSLFDIENNHAIVQFWHDSYEFYEENKSFKQYIRECMLIDENGNDTRVKA